MAHLVHLDRVNRRRTSVLWFLAHSVFGIDERHCGCSHHWSRYHGNVYRNADFDTSVDSQFLAFDRLPILLDSKSILA